MRVLKNRRNALAVYNLYYKLVVTNNWDLKYVGLELPFPVLVYISFLGLNNESGFF